MLMGVVGMALAITTKQELTMYFGIIFVVGMALVGSQISDFLKENSELEANSRPRMVHFQTLNGCGYYEVYKGKSRIGLACVCAKYYGLACGISDN